MGVDLQHLLEMWVLKLVLVSSMSYSHHNVIYIVCIEFCTPPNALLLLHTSHYLPWISRMKVFFEEHMLLGLISDISMSYIVTLTFGPHPPSSKRHKKDHPKGLHIKL